MTFSKPILATIIFITLVGGILSFPPIFDKKVAEATIGVPVNDFITEANQKIQTGLSFWQKVAKYWELYIRPALRDIAAKRLMDYITQQTLDWINNGQEPTFVGNWNQFAKDAGNIAFDSVNSYLETGGVDLCSPFVPQIQIMLQGTFIPSQPISCSIDNFLQNISNSTDMLKRGDWLSYSQVIMPENNPMGLYLISENRIYSEYMSQKEAKVNEAISSSGFLGQKTCAKLADGWDEGKISDACKNDEDPSSCAQFLTQNHCVSWDVKTPGSVAAQAVDTMVKSDSIWAAGIHNFVSAVINALVSKVFQQGLSALRSSSIDTDQDFVIGNDPNATANFNSVKNEWLQTYDDVIYYYNSSDYPTLQLWKDVQSLAEQGASTCSSTADWQKKYDDVSLIVNGLDAMVNAAKDNKAKIDQIDPGTMSASELSQQVSILNADYEDFKSNYDTLLFDISKAKDTGDMTDIQKSAIAEKDNLTQSLSTAPDCGSPNVTP